ncbi:MAG: S-adenosylmethionine:tRNA ribosyltransferase-isomerase [Vicinamibacteria bacterium]
MNAATAPRADAAGDRLLVVDPAAHTIDDRRVDDLPGLLRAGDVVVVNDAATLPASLLGRTAAGAAVELRLLGRPAAGGAWPVLAFGDGDWRTQTEDRPRPPALAVGDEVAFTGLVARVARVSAESPRLLDVRFDRTGDRLLEAIYARGRPVQYAYLPEPRALSAFQTPFAGRPWAAEMPSAGRVLTAARVCALRAADIQVRPLTHAAGPSSTGDSALDARLPLPEAYEIPAATAAAVQEARARGGRVVAVGTTVVRALESAADDGRRDGGAGVARLRLGAAHRLAVVDAILTGMHEPGSSHFDLLTAFAPADVLERAYQAAEGAGYRAHEFGDSMLVCAARPAGYDSAGPHTRMRPSWSATAM